ncbi:MAG: hypothetical protein K6G69_00065 [Lachnospiraceae bacterium]|nr:hypothetical protein [Lachnospiraceae bacterium]
MKVNFFKKNVSKRATAVGLVTAMLMLSACALGGKVDELDFGDKDFRSSNIGDPYDSVKSSENMELTKELTSENTGELLKENEKAVYYEGQIDGKDVKVIYYFIDDKLDNAMIIFNNCPDRDKYMAGIVDQYEKKYGESGTYKGSYVWYSGDNVRMIYTSGDKLYISMGNATTLLDS